ncbi:hypothetical protein [Aliarcobacter cryaerophilus]|uniref:hypothetical protein n=1 Tax=Aliarcobacter cryaerophilus TaxID=28198 RepID=UPI0021B5E3E6|nr:hypothetical protein [Aliarcobacter cryaerophilus]MCT7497513.1 hypothetical protein [Aliarcobacter cryaerophilus]
MKLQKPGSGLPNIERLFIKNFFVPILRTFFTWNIALFLLKREVSIIRKLTKELSQNELQKQIIINRTFAIEDDSRQFSISMVLEHLIIAGSLVKSTIESLSKENIPQDDIKIEDVKPFKNDKEILENFFKFYDSYYNMINNLEKKQSISTKKHPWFVNFNNFDWSIFMYMHTFIHRRQIQEIILNLKKGKNE